MFIGGVDQADGVRGTPDHTGAPGGSVDGLRQGCRCGKERRLRRKRTRLPSVLDAEYVGMRFADAGRMLIAAAG
jgi:hypothetical protein